LVALVRSSTLPLVPAFTSTELHAQIRRTIDGERDAMRDLLTALVAIPTENPPGRSYEPCVALLEAALERAGLEHRRVAIPGVAPEAYAIEAWLGPPGPALVLHGHYDVVPAFDEDQFRPRFEGETLFGRGSSDMKSGLVAMIHAARALRASGLPLARRLLLRFVPDEETGGVRGSGALDAAGLLTPDAIGMLLGEPTSGVVWHSNRGAITLEITVHGRAAHVGLAHQGINAFERAVAMVNEFVALRERVPSVLLIGGRVEAGTNFNTVPETCRFTIDRRTEPGEDFDAEKKQLTDIIERARAAGTNVTVHTLQEARAAATPPDTELGRVLGDAIHAVTGEPPVFEPCPGLLETRFYAARGVPAFAYGPGILAVSHGPKEFVKLTRVAECAEIYALCAARLLAS
jgi:acetylornithine deacetylase/succinyl-diaminopimelate desuccinylase-like protein